MNAHGRVRVTRDVPARMRDGATLYADVYRPEGGGPFPVLLMRTPYDKTQALTSVYGHPVWYARHGYMVVVQDVRGRWRSEGDWYPFAHEGADGYDTVEWAARLPESNGGVGMYGLSYAGATQLLAAVEAPPSLACVVPAITASEYYDGWTYRGGALQQAFVTWWALFLAEDVARRRGESDHEAELIAASEAVGRLCAELPIERLGTLRRGGIAPWFFDWLDHPSRDAYWERWSIERRHSHVRVPALHVAGWYDTFLDGSIRNFLGLKADAASRAAREGQRLVIGPWHHVSWGPIVSGWRFGDEARNPIDEIQLRWFDHWLKGLDNGVADEAPVRIFVMGEDRWRDEGQWPPARAVSTDFYLHSGGAANSINGDGWLAPEPPSTEDADLFVYDPAAPVPSLGGRSCCRYQVVPMGPAEQWPAEILKGVLVYTTPPLAAALEVTGPVSLVLFAATTACDTDWTAKLVDVHPDARAINVADGILRARFRDSLSTPTLVEPGRAYEYRIDLGATSHVFKAGHRLRLEVSSSNFPCYDRNLNTGGPLGKEPVGARVVATQTVFHDTSRPSRLLLPVVPGA